MAVISDEAIHVVEISYDPKQNLYAAAVTSRPEVPEGAPLNILLMTRNEDEMIFRRRCTLTPTVTASVFTAELVASVL